MVQPNGDQLYEGQFGWKSGSKEGEAKLFQIKYKYPGCGIMACEYSENTIIMVFLRPYIALP